MKISVILVFIYPLIAITNVGGLITENTVWGPTGNPPDTIYNLIDAVQVVSGVILTIQPGVKLQARSNHGFIIDGQLIAIGTSSGMIRFTSSVPSPQIGDWAGIILDEAVDSCLFNYCIIDYADYGINNVPVAPTLLRVEQCQISNSQIGILPGPHSLINNCNIFNNDSVGIEYQGCDTVKPVLSNNIISNNPIGILFSTLSDCPIFAQPNQFSNNVHSIEINSEQWWQGNCIWNPTVDGIDCWINNTCIHADVTIAPGNIFYLNGPGAGLNGNRIKAIGTETNNIIFTSANSSPNPGDWGAIDFSWADTCIFEHCIIEYADRGLTDFISPPFLMQIENSKISNCNIGIETRGHSIIRNCEISNNDSVGILYHQTIDTVRTEISNNLIQNNPVGLIIDQCYRTPVFSQPNQFVNNDHGIEIYNYEWWSNNCCWNPAINGIDCWVYGSIYIDANFTITPGNVFKLLNNSIGALGTINACGTETEKIIFTSQNPTPNPGDWYGLSVSNYQDTSIIEHCIIEYAEKNFDWPGYDESGFIKIQNSEIAHCSTAIFLNSYNYKASFVNNKIHDNGTGIAFWSRSTPTILYNELYNNTNWAIYNQDNNYWINAEFNWWGDSTGPCDTSAIDTLYNPGGLGDRVSDHVDYDPWLYIWPGVKEISNKPLPFTENSLRMDCQSIFNKQIIISYVIPNDGDVIIKIYNPAGQLVRNYQKSNLKCGIHTCIWDGKNDFVIDVPAGIYFCCIFHNGRCAKQKLIKLE